MRISKWHIWIDTQCHCITFGWNVDGMCAEISEHTSYIKALYEVLHVCFKFCNLICAKVLLKNRKIKFSIYWIHVKYLPKEWKWIYGQWLYITLNEPLNTFVYYVTNIQVVKSKCNNCWYVTQQNFDDFFLLCFDGLPSFPLLLKVWTEPKWTQNINHNGYGKFSLSTAFALEICVAVRWKVTHKQ